jgi:hypothetical protein
MTDKHALDHCITVVDLRNPRKAKHLYTGYDSIVCSLALHPKDQVFVAATESYMYARSMNKFFDLEKICRKNPLSFDSLSSLSFNFEESENLLLH